jgi:hypothetical protein
MQLKKNGISDDKIHRLSLIIYFILSISLILGLILGEDSSGGGSIVDFHSTWILVEKPFDPQSMRFEFKFPLHYWIAFIIFKILNDVFLFKLFYVLVTLLLPFLFCKCLEIKFSDVEKNKLFLFSLILLLLPSVRTSAVWPNTQITAIFFFLISIYYFLKWEQLNDFVKINKSLMLTLTFMSLAVYTRQIYALIYLYFVFIFYKKFSFKKFLQVCLITLIFAIPGLIFVIIWPKIIQVTFDSSLQNSLLVNLSIISFYLVPFFFIIFALNKKKFILDNKFFIFSTLSIIFIFISSNYFDYNFKMGGGVLMKVSLLLIGDYKLFFLSSFLGLISCYLLCKNNLSNIVLTLLIIFGISAYVIFQKYHEPMMLILMFLIYKNDDFKLFFKKKLNIFLFLLYFFSYLISAILFEFYNVKENLLLS